MDQSKTASWVPCTIDDEIVSYTCSNCEEEEGPDALKKYRRCPNCNCKMDNAL